MWKILFMILFSFSLFPLCGQKTAFSENEQQISLLFDSLRVSNVDEDKKRISDAIAMLLAKELKSPGSFENQYASLNFMGKVFSDDNKVKIYTWNYPLDDKTYGYGGFIQYKPNNKTIKTIPLTVKTQAYLPATNKRISLNDWYGALYYKIISVTYKKENYYVLLGWAGNTAISDFKLIEILTVNESGNAYLGRLVFKQKNKIGQQRFVLEYSADAKVSLSYDPRMKKIIFDHLVPSEPVYANVYSYYGPDFTYDAFALEEGKWVFEEDIDVKNRE